MNDDNTQPPASGDGGNSPTDPQSQASDPAVNPVVAADTSSMGKIVSPLQSDDELSEDQFVTGGDDHSFITTIPVPPHPNTKFDENKFLQLLAASISLTKTEKQRIITSIPKLSQYQIDELIRIFEEEQKKFADLNAKHADQLKELEAKHKDDWNDLEMQAKQADKQKQDEDEAETLRRKLGLK